MSDGRAGRFTGYRRPGATHWWLDVLGLAGLIGVFIRLLYPAIRPPSLWFDDSIVAVSARLDGVGQAWETVFTAPGFTILLYGWFEIVGFSEMRAQALPLVFGLCVAPAMYWATRRLWPAGAGPWLAATLATLSPLVVQYSPRVKPYSFDVLISAIVLGLAAAAVERPTQQRRWTVVAVSSLAIAMSAAVAIFAATAVGVLTLQAMVAVDDDRDRRRHIARVARPAIAFVTFAGVWHLGVLRSTISQGMREYWSPFYLDPYPVRTFITELWHGLQASAAALSPLPTSVALALLVAGAARLVWQLRRSASSTVDERTTRSSMNQFVAAVVVVPWLGAAAMATLHLAPWGGGRTGSALVVPTAVAVTALVVHLGSRPVMRVAATVVALVVGGWTVADADPAAYPDDDIKSVLDQVRKRDADTILVSPGPRHQYVLYAEGAVHLEDYDITPVGYLPSLDDPKSQLLAGDPEDPGRYLPMVRDAVGTSDTVWLLTSKPLCGSCVEVFRWEDDLALTFDALSELGFQQLELVASSRYQATRWARF